MQDVFNTASLAKLSRQELLALLANLQSELSAVTGDAERRTISTKIEAVKCALSA